MPEIRSERTMVSDFFGYKLEFEGYDGGDLFGTIHILFMVGAFLFTGLVCVLTRKTPKRRVEIFLNVLLVVVPVLEAAKICWESYYDIHVYGGQFNFSGLLPLYPCSLFLYALPLAAWAKGKPKDFALSFLTTMGVFFGLTNFVYLNVLKIYPLFTYASMVSFNYHFLMVFTGIFLQATGYYRPRLYSVFKAEGLFALYALVPATVNYIGNRISPFEWFDYCFLYNGNSFPFLLSQVRQALGEDLRLVYTLLVIAGFTLPALVAFGVSQGIRGMAGIFGRKKQAHAVQKEKYMSKIR